MVAMTMLVVMVVIVSVVMMRVAVRHTWVLTEDK